MLHGFFGFDDSKFEVVKTKDAWVDFYTQEMRDIVNHA
jgi:hypothetical protein